MPWFPPCVTELPKKSEEVGDKCKVPPPAQLRRGAEILSQKLHYSKITELCRKMDRTYLNHQEILNMRGGRCLLTFISARTIRRMTVQSICFHIEHPRPGIACHGSAGNGVAKPTEPVWPSRPTATMVCVVCCIDSKDIRNEWLAVFQRLGVDVATGYPASTINSHRFKD